jgi:hypothetical protein
LRSKSNESQSLFAFPLFWDTNPQSRSSLQVHLTELLSGLSIAHFQYTLQQLRSGQERLARFTAFLDTWQPEPSPKSVLPADSVTGHPLPPAVYVNGHPSPLREPVTRHNGDDSRTTTDVFLPSHLAQLAQHETEPVRRLTGGSLEGACRQDCGSFGGCEITEGLILDERMPIAGPRKSPSDEKEATQRELLFGVPRRGGCGVCPGRGEGRKDGVHVQVELQMLERGTLEPGSWCSGTVAGCSPFREDQEALLLATFCELPKSPKMGHQQGGSEQGLPQAKAMLTVESEVRLGCFLSRI